MLYRSIVKYLNICETVEHASAFWNLQVRVLSLGAFVICFAVWFRSRSRNHDMSCNARTFVEAFGLHGNLVPYQPIWVNVSNFCKPASTNKIEQPCICQDPLKHVVCQCICRNACSNLFIHTYIFAYVCVYICMYIYIYIYICMISFIHQDSKAYLKTWQTSSGCLYGWHLKTLRCIWWWSRGKDFASRMTFYNVP